MRSATVCSSVRRGARSPVPRHGLLRPSQRGDAADEDEQRADGHLDGRGADV